MKILASEPVDGIKRAIPKYDRVSPLISKGIVERRPVTFEAYSSNIRMSDEVDRKRPVGRWDVILRIEIHRFAQIFPDLASKEGLQRTIERS